MGDARISLNLPLKPIFNLNSPQCGLESVFREHVEKSKDSVDLWQISNVMADANGDLIK